ncbi:bifunctional ADP-dependent NAD(P)H-hydrate dehydratase/NAD(P)H-hydrate epimerase [Aeromicrobium phragmitis]|uniref:Bifunctional NAD(P)H-hydrate repair enzyme n=1 Tax=Aeromicrobium phragmitis TaxID=2478914 RepID=A0A3L8PMG9_9ACTN|nr:bifunctional ADP-dependent NAD(P)H-hydrate dehydratase/NAD(P)H-hydrate epimerase [Aeromicrobium phragmitis]RLV56535.1 bifunctional ADP-dependent NAD(P)H-hydrate dehydratase/NAD(P)H-hydrate epimerase [Aeromicrobium phragmitis]
MLTAHRVAGIRAAEEAAAASAGWDGLMQRAVAELTEVLVGVVPETSVPVVLVGPGNNGGDALFAAAALCRRGRRVDLALLDRGHVHEAGLADALAAGARLVDGPGEHAYAVDAIFGIGARPGLEGRAAEWARWVEDRRPFVVAVDVPSGIGVDDGARPGVSIAADLTVTFGTAKVGLLVGRGGLASGRVLVRDIGLTPHLPAPAAEALEAGDADRYRSLVPGPETHKYERGVVGIEAGSPEYAGAAHLCVAGAQAGPAGMVRFVGEADLAARVVDRAPEVVAGRGRVQAWVVGPGGEDSPAPLAAALADGVPVVVDASALGHLPERLRPDVLLTPHAGELARLLDVERADVEGDPLGHARRAAERWNATVLLKGPRTLVVSPDGRVRVNLSGTPWLGTAGAGDVLAGFIGSLLAAGLDTVEAGSLGAFLHGVAGVRAAQGGPFPAHAVADHLSGALHDFLEGVLDDEGTR